LHVGACVCREFPDGNGGENGRKGENRLNGELLPGKCAVQVKTGDRLRIATPGGGGWGDSRDKK
jgi:N-methylhydantoinase B